MEELGLSAEEMSGYDTRTDVPNKKMESSSNIHLEITIRDRAEPYCSMSGTAMVSAPISPCHGTTNTEQSSAHDSQLEYPPQKLQKVCENRENFGGDLMATETAVLQWIKEHDKVGLFFFQFKIIHIGCLKVKKHVLSWEHKLFAGWIRGYCETIQRIQGGKCT